MPIDSHLPQADPFSLVPTFKCVVYPVTVLAGFVVFGVLILKFQISYKSYQLFCQELLRKLPALPPGYVLQASRGIKVCLLVSSAVFTVIKTSIKFSLQVRAGYRVSYF
jgi:hypothetical protein